jgi:hypothetical protein
MRYTQNEIQQALLVLALLLFLLILRLLLLLLLRVLQIFHGSSTAPGAHSQQQQKA